MNYYEIGQRIRHFRKSLGLSQEELAERTGISVTHMSHIETGNTKLSLAVLVHMADALGVSTDELLFDTPQNQRQIGEERIRAVLESCTPREAKIIAEIVESAKAAMDKYG